MSTAATFEAERKRLTGVAYRMLGRWSEAEDAVQDAYLRWQAADHGVIEQPAAWLTTVVVRLCLDRLRRAKASREVYVGPWLPEPVLTPEGGERRDEEAENFADDLSLGLMVVLERLGPEERAAFILREAFDSSYGDIASALGKNEAAVRQLVSRARDRVRAERPRFRADPSTHTRLLGQFTSALAANDTSALLSIMTADVRFVSDGGGKRPAALRVLNNPEEVAKLLLHIAGAKGGVRQARGMTLNGVPSLWFEDAQGYDTVMQFDVADDLIRAIFIVRNPDKLAHLNLH
ncbi:MAG: RNA polymerase sigma factor SigJ [Alphaproteobacteria bacterium]|jgi:RNA polymerase sigma-70 factor (ECF subfamily)|nr:RNA polymerase sigma factor SigJ [Alphaproteobacteria bacterium]